MLRECSLRASSTNFRAQGLVTAPRLLRFACFCPLLHRRKRILRRLPWPPAMTGGASLGNQQYGALALTTFIALTWQAGHWCCRVARKSLQTRGNAQAFRRETTTAQRRQACTLDSNLHSETINTVLDAETLLHVSRSRSRTSFNEHGRQALELPKVRSATLPALHSRQKALEREPKKKSLSNPSCPAPSTPAQLG